MTKSKCGGVKCQNKAKKMPNAETLSGQHNSTQGPTKDGRQDDQATRKHPISRLEGGCESSTSRWQIRRRGEPDKGVAPFSWQYYCYYLFHCLLPPLRMIMVLTTAGSDTSETSAAVPNISTMLLLLLVSLFMLLQIILPLLLLLLFQIISVALHSLPEIFYYCSYYYYFYYNIK